MSDELRYQSIIRAVQDTPWAILPSKLAEIKDLLAFRATGALLTEEEIQQRIGVARERPKLRANGDIAVLPLMGTISHRMNLLSASSGGTSVEQFTKDFRALVNDPSVAAIVLQIDSPGGSVDGVPELADEIYQARGTKPISAVADTMAASAAYWIGSAADELAITPSGEVGSIGVIAAHEDLSGMYDLMGVKTSLITAGKYKGENNPFEPLSDEGRAAIQARVDDAYGMFTKAVARNRGVPLASVRDGFGQGRLVSPRDAVTQGMADRIATIDQVIATVGRRRTSQADTAALAAYSTTPAMTFEEQSEAALTAVQALHARVRALTALREGRSPIGQANVPRIQAHRDALLALAEDYDVLLGDTLQALVEPEAASENGQELLRFLVRAARQNGVAIA